MDACKEAGIKAQPEVYGLLQQSADPERQRILDIYMQPIPGSYRTSYEGSAGSIVDVVVTHPIDGKGKSLKYGKDTSSMKNAAANGAEKRKVNIYNQVTNISAFKVHIFSIDTSRGMAK